MFMKHGLSIYSHRLSDGFNDGCNTHQAPDQRRPGNRNPCPKSWRSQILFSKVFRRIHCEKHRKIRVPFLKEWILWEHSEFWNSRRIWRCWHKATSNWTSLKCSPESHHSDWKMDPVSWSVLVVLTPEHGLLSENWGKTTHTHTRQCVIIVSLEMTTGSESIPSWGHTPYPSSAIPWWLHHLRFLLLKCKLKLFIGQQLHIYQCIGYDPRVSPHCISCYPPASSLPWKPLDHLDLFGSIILIKYLFTHRFYIILLW